MTTTTTCGNCRFTERTSEHLECHGAPPQAVTFMQQSPTGQTQVRIEFRWPFVLPAARGCHLWALKLVTLEEITRDSRGQA